MIAITARDRACKNFVNYRRWLRFHQLAYPAVAMVGRPLVVRRHPNGHLALMWLGGMTVLTPAITLTALRLTPPSLLIKAGLLVRGAEGGAAPARSRRTRAAVEPTQRQEGHGERGQPAVPSLRHLPGGVARVVPAPGGRAAALRPRSREREAAPEHRRRPGPAPCRQSSCRRYAADEPWTNGSSSWAPGLTRPAGRRAAARARFEGEIIIIGDERLPPYHRPALSKQLLMGAMRPSDLTAARVPGRQRQVAARAPPCGTCCRAAGRCSLPGGEELKLRRADHRDRCRGAPAERRALRGPRVLVLRTLPDALDLERSWRRTAARSRSSAAGSPAARSPSSLRHMGREVTLIGRGKNLLGNVLGQDLGEWLTKLHTRPRRRPGARQLGEGVGARARTASRCS